MSKISWQKSDQIWAKNCTFFYPDSFNNLIDYFELGLDVENLVTTTRIAHILHGTTGRLHAIYIINLTLVKLTHSSKTPKSLKKT